MKKFCLMLCLFTLLLAAPAFAAKTGLDIHKGAFGPEIKGLQLGMPMTLRQLKQTMRDTFSFSEFVIFIWGINGFSSGDYLFLRYREDKDGHLHHEIVSGTYKHFEQYDSDGDIFDEIEKIGYGITLTHDTPADGDGKVRINIEHNRVSFFSFNSSVFGAGSMSFEEFAQTLRNAYPLPPLEKSKHGYYEGYNRPEGWRVFIVNNNDDNDEDDIRISTTVIPDSD